MALGGKKDNKPTRLISANERLDAAMVRLDKALAANNSDTDGAEITTLRSENERLSGLNKLTGERLDGAIKRLKTVLKEV
ncbi:MAG: hypothetical protein HQ513_07580 [Rhodospirillales bacterium]|nr:hypothetical protein [Rhodospirillales bacterium]